MRFLGIGEYNSLGDMYYRLQMGGHDVRVFVEKAAEYEVFQGLVQTTPDWRGELDWIKAAGDQGIIVFETASHGVLQDQLRQQGFNVIGGSAYGDRLEADRPFGQQVLGDLGLKIATTHSFSDFDSALEFLSGHPGRYVLKHNGTISPSMSNFVGESPDGSDMYALLVAERERARRREPDRPAFVLMQHLDGVEVGVGAFFNGRGFLRPAVVDWEHKRFFPGDLGELTGEMGTVVTYRDGEKLFDASLGLMAARLAAGRYCGYINLNMIVNEEGIWPLEFTCRFGYPGFAICDALHREGWDSIFHKMIQRSELGFLTEPGYAVGVVLTIPPFPYEDGFDRLSKDTPINFRPGTMEAQRQNLHYAEVGLKDGHLVASGSTGYLMVATGIGANIPEAQKNAYEVASMVMVPNLRYRNDIGDKLVQRDLGTLRRLGYLP